MADDNDSKWFLKAVRDRVKENEEHDWIQQITNAIGERRSRDLLDLVATLELELGWSTVLSFLRQSINCSYPTPLSFGGQETKLEPLKYREMIFELFSCTGFEPAKLDTENLLASLKDTQSHREASGELTKQLLSMVKEQITAGDTLFFFSDETDIRDQKLATLLETQRKRQFDNLYLKRINGDIDITPLWHTELGRRALANLGIRGNRTTEDELATVLSVLQLSQQKSDELRNRLIAELGESTNYEITEPSNTTYSKLLSSMIDQDLESMRMLGSHHSTSVLNALLFQSIEKYQSTESSDNYRQIIQYIDTHTSIRTLDSLATFQTLVELKIPRIVTPAVSALSSYFHESAATILISLVCNNRDQWIVSPSINALENIMTKCPEAIQSLSMAVKSECLNSGPLKRLLRKMPQRREWYYQ